MEGFWDVLKHEYDYKKRFTSKPELFLMIINYINYYNNRLMQRNLSILKHFEKHNSFLAA